jgi:hypothetical protein
MADLIFAFDAAETRSDRALDYGYDAIHLVAKTGAELRADRLIAERGAAALYAGMVFINVFIAPMILPLVQLDWVGVLTGGAWGSAPLSGAGFAAGYLAATLAKVFTWTNKTHAMLRDLERLAGDPGSAPKAKARYQEFRKQILAGEHALGRHRREMMARGYRPRDPTAMSCEARLGSAIL